MDKTIKLCIIIAVSVGAFIGGYNLLKCAMHAIRRAIRLKHHDKIEVEDMNL